MLSVKELINQNFIMIEGNESFSKVLPLFKNTDAIVVVDGKNYKGMLIKRDLMRAKIPLTTKVHSFLTYAPKLISTEPIEEISRLMVESGIYHLPVFEDDKLVGVVKAEDILNKVVGQEFGDHPIKNYMTTQVITIAPDDTIGKAIKLFKEQDISHLPVVENAKIVGLMTMDDILERVMHPEYKTGGWGEYGDYMRVEKRKIQLPVKGIMAEEPVVIPPEETIKGVIEHMLKSGSRGVLIGKDGQLQGIVTRGDLLNLIVVTKEEIIKIQFDKRACRVEGFDREMGLNFLKEEFVRKYDEFLEAGYLYISLKQHKETNRGMPLITCQIRLSSLQGMFYASDEGWGFMQALRNAAGALERQITKAKRNGLKDYQTQKSRLIKKIT